MTASALYSGEVMHVRLRPRRHRLRYRVFSLLLDLDELMAVDARLRLLSVNRRNVLAFHEADHGDGSKTPLKTQVDEWLLQAGLPTGGRVRLLTMPRILGYAFNPLSVYFCDAPAGGLQAIVHEVNSTFGERHFYLLAVSARQGEAARAGGRIALECAKKIHVSPFIGMAARYAFHIRVPLDEGERPLHVGVDVVDEDGPLLRAALIARAQPLDDRHLLKALLLHPLLTLKVIAAIHWEALRLFAKRVPLQPRPPVTQEQLTIVPHP